MTKAEIIKKIETEAGVTNGTAKIVADTVFRTISEALATGEGVQIAGFGGFAVKSRAARAGKNPRTGELIQIEASKTVGFKPAKTLKDMLN